MFAKTGIEVFKVTSQVMRGRMKRLLVLIVVLSLLVLGGTLVSAEGRTRRYESKFGRKARTAAIIAGGAGVGALVGERRCSDRCGRCWHVRVQSAKLDVTSRDAHARQEQC